MNLNFIGLANYFEVLKDPDWWKAFVHTLYFVVADVMVGIPLGFLCALTLNKKYPLKPLIVGIVMFPYILPPIVNALLWKLIYNPDYGFLNSTLINLGLIKDPIYWLISPNLALIALIIANLWQGTAFATIIYLGGLQSIPFELYEASKIDGATKRKTLRYITIPLMKPYTSLLLVMKTILTFKIFEIVYLLTGGGPGGSTTVVSYQIYHAAFEAFKFGKASAMSYILLCIVAIIVFVYQKILGSESSIL
ncbi:carbohydrate ABC transporter permease [Petrotoga miotherma]|nr:sugar ABC transporter permease [Petrotoga miotherma]